MSALSTPNPNQSESRLCLVAVWHRPEDCPLEQTTTDRADGFATALKRSGVIGVFSMQAHHGLVIMRTADSNETIIEMVAHLAAYKQPTIVAEAPPAAAAMVERYLEQPELLEDPSERLKLLAIAADLKPFEALHLERTEVEGLPTLSLQALADYLPQEIRRRLAPAT